MFWPTMFHNKMKNKKYHTVGIVQKYHTVGIVQKYNRKIVERGNINTPNTQIHDL
jgi:hypothetical protein